MQQVILTLLLVIGVAFHAFAESCDPSAACPQPADAAPAKTLIVAGYGGNFTTIQGALDAASDGDTILVYPGTYNEQLTVGDDNIAIRGMGSPDAVVITYDDQTVITLNTRTGFLLENVTVEGAANSSTDYLIGSTDSSGIVRNCILTQTMTSSVAAVQPCILWAGGGTTHSDFTVEDSVVSYTHSGSNSTIYKLPFRGGTSSSIRLLRNRITSSCSGQSLVCAGVGDFSVAMTFDVRFNTFVVTHTDASNQCSDTTGVQNNGASTWTIVGNQFDIENQWNNASANARGVLIGNVASTVYVEHNHFEIDATGSSNGDEYVVETGGTNPSTYFSYNWDTATDGYCTGSCATGTFDCIGDSGHDSTGGCP